MFFNFRIHRSLHIPQLSKAMWGKLAADKEEERKAASKELKRNVAQVCHFADVFFSHNFNHLTNLKTSIMFACLDIFLSFHTIIFFNSTFPILKDEEECKAVTEKTGKTPQLSSQPPSKPPCQPSSKKPNPYQQVFWRLGKYHPYPGNPLQARPSTQGYPKSNHSLSASFLSLLDNCFDPNLLTLKPTHPCWRPPRTPIPKKGDLLATAMQECELNLSGSFNLFEPIPKEDSNPPE